MSDRNGNLPEGWAMTELGDVGQIIRGVTYKYKKDQAQTAPAPGLMPLLRATNILDFGTFEPVS